MYGNVGCPWVPPRNCCQWLGGVTRGQGWQGATSPTIREGYPPKTTTDNWGGLPGVGQGTATDDDGRLQRHFKTRTDEDIQLGGVTRSITSPQTDCWGGLPGVTEKTDTNNNNMGGYPPNVVGGGK